MKFKRLNSDCLSCLAKTQLNKYPDHISEAEKLEYKQRILKILADADWADSAPVLVNRMDKLRIEMFCQSTDYSDVKHYFNEYVMNKQTRIMEDIEKSNDSLLRSLQYSMTGNYIDFGAMESVKEEHFEELLLNAKDITLDVEQYKSFQKDLTTAKTLVFLHDNCGEVVFDHCLIKTLQKMYPSLKIISIVRGFPVLNDATMDDAQQIGLTKSVQVIANGSSIAGTCLEDISTEALDIIQNADIILSKGQANFETLHGCGYNVYYLFMCKCILFANRFHKKLYEGMLINDSAV